MRSVLDLERYPLDRLRSPRGAQLIDRCRADLATTGMFNLDGLLTPAALQLAVAEVAPLLETASFTHRRSHNIYFRDDLPGLAPDHPALRLCETVNRVICADQIAESVLLRLYEWTSFADFLAAAMQRPRLYTMADPLARVNVMSYGDGEALNWHFDRSEFTTTLLLQAPEAGGAFEYRSDLRSDDDPNYDGVSRLLEGRDPDVRTLGLAPGSLNVFKGRNTAHRVSPVAGPRARIIAVFSYYDRPDVVFSDRERLGFYGRAA